MSISELEKALLGRRQDEERYSITVRLRDGEEYVFTVRPMTYDENLEFTKLGTLKAGKKGKEKEIEFYHKYTEFVVTNCVINPNFKSEEFIRALEVTSPEEAAKKVLGCSMAQVVRAIHRLSGFAEDVEEAYESAKKL